MISQQLAPDQVTKNIKMGRDSEEKRHKSKSRKKSRDRSDHDHKHKRKEQSPPSSIKLLKTLEERRIRDHLEKKKMKEELKANETPSEKRTRRIMEKQAKEIRRRQRMGWDTEYQHYTNQDNPFGDSNLMSTFVWNKKLEKDGLEDVSVETVEALSRHKQLENKVELEKIKKRRKERELEKQAREDENILQQRSKEAAQFQEWERQEDKFHLEQARLRSVIRIQDGRAKPIDLLAQYISNTALEDSIEMQMHEPYFLLNGLEIKDLEDLLVDIKVYVELEKGKNSEFWDDMTVIVQDELNKLQKLPLNPDVPNVVGSRREGIHQNVAKDVSEIFRGKNADQLDELRQRIEQKISGRNDGVDISYWESLLSQLKAHMARARLRDRHQHKLRQKLQLLKTEDQELPSTSQGLSSFTKNESHEDSGEDSNLASTADAHQPDLCIELYEEGRYSPQYLPYSNMENSTQILTQDDLEQRIEQLRIEFFEKIQEGQMSQDELKMRCEARKEEFGDEAEFSVEVPLGNSLQLSTDKYRPRKPRYFNRVHTGFEWNKYNQTHYDMDNPPPKIVQGYKFNIFYPDLIDKSTTPAYYLSPCEDNPDFAVLRFHAGPPYEDIAFKIVNREWEFSYKRGFRCQFHNNIFQLWFHFKRYRYRR